MKKQYLSLFALVLAISSCSPSQKDESSTNNHSDNSVIMDEGDMYPTNGGFETADLSGWTIVSGDAYDDDSVSSVSTFSFSDDDRHQDIPVSQTGNWYLSGKGFDGKRSFSRTGVIKSSNFVLASDGILSMKLAGGALTKGKGTSASMKSLEKICYVGVYLASNDQMIARQTNEYFLEHTESYVNVNQYKNGVYNTDNFVEYTLDLSKYAGKTVYLKIVDNDTDSYYGYLSVDDIRNGSSSSPQEEGTYFVKTREYTQTLSEHSEYEIANGGFEDGSLAGWDIISGQAFSNEGVNPEKTWWNEAISYNRDGNYHYGMYNPSATGVMRSSVFTLGGSGYITYKLGGCMDQSKTYMRFLILRDGKEIEIGRASNFKYNNDQFPYIANGMRLLNLNQYYVNFSRYLGEKMQIEVVDENSSSDDLGSIVLDSINTYNEKKPTFYNETAYEYVVDDFYDVELESEFQVKNGTFEQGNFDGWSFEGEPFVEIMNKNGWWNESFAYNKKGEYFVSGENVESKTGKLISSSFTIGGSGFISFRLGGGRDPLSCYLSIVDDETKLELARFANTKFNDLGTGLLSKGSNLLNMISYNADFSKYIGKKVHVELVDNASNSWGLVSFDSLITYYPTKDSVPSESFVAVNQLDFVEEENEFQVKNGTFEKGNLDGWTLNGNIGGVSSLSTWWNECFSYEKQGSYFFNGWSGSEGDIGTLESSEFTLSGTGFISFRLGGMKNTEQCYLSIIDVDENKEIARYGNTKFRENALRYFYEGKDIVLSKDNVYKANMASYKADLSAFLGKKLKLKLVDNATNDWGLIFADDFSTYYKDEMALPKEAALAINLLANERN